MVQFDCGFLLPKKNILPQSLHPSHLKTETFVLHRRMDLLTHLQAYIKAEPKGPLTCVFFA